MRINKMGCDGTVLIVWDDQWRVIRSSQVATGEENGLAIIIMVEKAAFKWGQENRITYIN